MGKNTKIERWARDGLDKIKRLEQWALDVCGKTRKSSGERSILGINSGFVFSFWLFEERWIV